MLCMVSGDLFSDNYSPQLHKLYSVISYKRSHPGSLSSINFVFKCIFNFFLIFSFWIGHIHPSMEIDFNISKVFEGAVTLLVDGDDDKVNRCLDFIETIKGEPPLLAAKGSCKTCPVLCSFQGKEEDELPAYLK